MLSHQVQHRTYFIIFIMATSCNGVVDLVTRPWAGQSRVSILAGQKIFLFSKTFRLAVGPTQPPIKWVLNSLPRGTVAGACSWPLTPI